MELLRNLAEASADSLGQNIPHIDASQATLEGILNVIYGLAGALAVIFIIVGGIRYTLSAGESGNISKAKSTILYAVVGLIVVILAFAITNFLLGAINVSSWPALRDSVINKLIYIAGTLAVIMIIYGAFRYITAGGNSSAITKAKDTVLFAIVGLIVAILAFAIVNFVVGKI